MSNAIVWTIIVLVWLLAIPVAAIGLHRQAIVECDTWQEQAKEFPGFYLLKWQQEQCDSLNITIHALVK